MKKIRITEEQYKNIQEAYPTGHMMARKTQRLHHVDLPIADINATEQKLKKVIETDYPNSTAIRLHKFKPDSKHKYYHVQNSVPFYRIPEGTVFSRGRTIVKKSIGDEFWVIVRGNKIKTFLLRRSNDGRNVSDIKKILNVSEVIY